MESATCKQHLNPLLNIIRGRVIALGLATNGYDVCINHVEAYKNGCNEVVKEIRGLGRKSFAFTANISNPKEVQELVQASVSELGPLDTMVANAGVAQVKALLDLTEQNLQRMFVINGRATYLGSTVRSLTNSRWHQEAVGRYRNLFDITRREVGAILAWFLLPAARNCRA